jgi:uncharacterized membrane protein
MKYVPAVRACHNSIVSARRPSPAAVLALALAALVLTVSGCTKSGVQCVPPPANLVCPEAGAPSFSGDVFPNVFVPVCDNCHAPGKTEANRPLTTYLQIYGTNGTEARSIFNQVFESCLMPPSNAPEPLTDSARQTLLDWFACGALDDSPSVDASAGN